VDQFSGARSATPHRKEDAMGFFERLFRPKGDPLTLGLNWPPTSRDAQLAATLGLSASSSNAPARGTTVGAVVAKAILRSEGQLDGMVAIEYMDIVRAICNTNFSKSSIEAGLQHRHQKVRMLVKEFLQDLGR
jgi:hypothetical protein